MAKKMSLHEMAIRLCEGGIVEYGGYGIKAVQCDGDDNPCYLCEMDCICDLEMTDLCAECDGITRSKHFLKLAIV